MEHGGWAGGGESAAPRSRATSRFLADGEGGRDDQPFSHGTGGEPGRTKVGF